MKRLKLFLFIVVISISTKNTFAQISFSHTAGAAAYIADVAVLPAVVYSPRANLLQLGSEATVSLGTHLGFGFNYNTAGTDNYFGYELPLLAEINLGCGSSPDSDVGFGGFLGLGYGVNKMGASNSIGSVHNEASGIYVNGGIRAIINDQPLGLRVSYLMNNKVGFSDVIGLSFFYMLGE